MDSKEKKLPEELNIAAEDSGGLADPLLLEQAEAAALAGGAGSSEAGGTAGAGGVADPLLLAQAGAAAPERGAGAGEAGSGAAAGAGTGAMAGGVLPLVAIGLAAAALAAGGGGGDSPAAPPTISGVVADGRISGAAIFVDANGDGIAQAGENTGLTTNAAGAFSGTTTLVGALMATGGLNIDTNLPNNIVLKAPAGSTVINPLTTLLQEMIESGVPAASAEAKIIANLGLPAIDLNTYDPWAQAATDATALAVQKSAAQIVVLMEVALSNGAASYTAVIEGLAAAVNAGAVDLTNAVDLAAISGVPAGAVSVIRAATAAIAEATTLDLNADSGLSAIQEATLDTTGDNAPLFISDSTATGAENTTAVMTVHAVDVHAVDEVALTYSIAGGADAAKFAINATTGVLTFVAAPDFEAPTDAGGNNVYDVMVGVSDGTHTETQAISVTVTDVAEAVIITSVTDSAANLVANTGGQVTGAVNVTVTGTATIAQLTAIDALTTGTLTYTSITDSGANLAANAGGYVTGAVNVTVTGTPGLTGLTTIDGLTTGTLTYTSITGSGADLSANTGGYVTGAVNVTVTGTPGLTALATIDGLTTGTLTYTSVTASSAAGAAANAGGYITGAVNVTLTGAATIAQLSTIDGLTTGTLSYSLSDTAANLAAAAAATGNGATDITATTAATVAQANAILAFTNSGTNTYSLSDTAANLAAAAAATGNGATDITATTAATVAQATTIGDAFTNTGTTTYDIADSGANILAGAAGVTSGAGTVTVSDTPTVSVANANTLLALDPAMTYNVSDTGANLEAAGATGAGAIDITATAATVAQVTTILALGNSGATVYNLSDSAFNLNAADAPTRDNAFNITATTAATVIQGTTIDSATNGGTTTYDITDSMAAVAVAFASNAINNAGIVTANGTTGADTFDVATAIKGMVINGFEASDTITAGTGNDSIFGGVDNDTITDVAGTNAIDGGDGDDIITGGTGNDTITGGVGNDTMVGGTGDDTFFFASIDDLITPGGTGTVIDTGSLSGDADNDRIQVAGAIEIDASDSLAGAVSIEELVAATQSADPLAHSIVMAANAALASVRTIDLSGDTNSGSSSTIDMTGITLAMTLKGVDGGADLITGGSVADTITGGGGADTIAGAFGADVIHLLETTQAVDTVVVGSGASGVGGVDQIDKFNAAATLADRLDLPSTTILVDGPTDGADVGMILSHFAASGMISFDNLDAFGAPLIVTTGATDVGSNLINVDDVDLYLENDLNIADGVTAAFYVDANGDGLYNNSADFLRVYQGEVASDIFVDIFTTAGLGAVIALSTTAAANTVMIA